MVTCRSGAEDDVSISTRPRLLRVVGRLPLPRLHRISAGNGTCGGRVKPEDLDYPPSPSRSLGLTVQRGRLASQEGLYVDSDISDLGIEIGGCYSLSEEELFGYPAYTQNDGDFADGAGFIFVSDDASVRRATPRTTATVQ